MQLLVSLPSKCPPNERLQLHNRNHLFRRLTSVLSIVRQGGRLFLICSGRCEQLFHGALVIFLSPLSDLLGKRAGRKVNPIRNLGEVWPRQVQLPGGQPTFVCLLDGQAVFAQKVQQCKVNRPCHRNVE